jgi:hypothetical protein
VTLSVEGFSDGAVFNHNTGVISEVGVQGPVQTILHDGARATAAVESSRDPVRADYADHGGCLDAHPPSG